jgi:hypothetical protein
MEREVITGLDAKPRFIQHGARRPRLFRDPSDECNPHMRRSVEHIKDGLNCFGLSDREYIVVYLPLCHAVRSISPIDRLYGLSLHVNE